ncbi:MAG: four helix bundle protein [Bacteroidetes bacterium]|nr:four helix bundle protein [Bacteroidota bacterium]
MRKMEQLEDLDCRKAVRKLVNCSCGLLVLRPLSKDYTIKDQLKRTALSTMNNIAERPRRYSDSSAIRHLEISFTSRQEDRSIL